MSEIPVGVRATTFDDWWARTTALAGPLAGRLAELPPPAIEALRARLRDAVRPFETPDGLQFPGVTLLATAHRPA